MSTWGIPANVQVAPEPWKTPDPPHLGGLRDEVELEYPVSGLNAEQVELLTVWENTKNQLKVLKEYEMQLRKIAVYDSGLFDNDKTSGTENIALGDGYKLTSVKKETYHLKADDNGEAVEKALDNFTDIEAGLLVKWTPELSVSNYKKLPEDKQAYFNDCLEIRTGAPSLEIKPPKAK